MPNILFRQGTWDENIWNSVVKNNEYGLGQFQDYDVVIDIGAHIGGFTYKALDCGAWLVVAVEPDTESANYWRHNLHTVCKAENRSILITAAAWRNDDLPEKALHYAAVGLNTGGGNTLGATGVEVRAVPLDSIIVFAASLSINGRIRLLKLDCEGAEWPMLLTSGKLHLVDEIIGEYHEIDDLKDWPAARVADLNSYSTELLRQRLIERGFHVTIENMGKIGKFRAWRDSQ